jgi:thioesterase domain-containing protein/acyl carrier protein
MVPTAFVFLDALPLTASGKVDRRALPPWQPPARGPSDRPPQDFLETQVAAIWEDLLGLPNIGIGDDFFELGGDSLLAVEMGVRVEQMCGARVSLPDFFPDLTIEKIAKALLGQQNGSQRQPLVEIQGGGAGRPFFFAHGDFETGGFYCRNLSRLVGADQPFYALQPHGLDGKPVPRTIQAMAADRLAAVLAFQPSGPYLLGGFCAGGMVAFEMAQQLRKRGQRVDLVLMIDARAPNARFRAADRLVGGVAWLLRLGPGTRSRLFRRLRRFLAAFADAWHRGIGALIVFVLKKPYSVTRGVLGEAEPEGPSAPLNEWQQLWQEHHEALEDYVPQPYPGRLVLLRSALMAPGDPVAEWQHVNAGVLVQPIPGNHKTCVTRYVEDLAAAMRAHLRTGG